MKKIFITLLAFITGIVLISPVTGYSESYGPGRGRYPGPPVYSRGYSGWGPYYGGNYYTRSHHGDDGWVIAGVALGGIVLGSIIGSVIAQPRIDNTDRPGCAGPAPGSMAYAAPDGAYGHGAPSEGDNPPGQWVNVPGQWVNGKWVPGHKAWVPVNP